MPIDISSEPPVSLTQATAHVPRRRAGRKPAASTLYRWATVGLRGVRLETIQIGGTKCTSLKALQRFFDRLSDRGSDPAPVDRDADDRQRRAGEALQDRWAKGVR